jgi:hypothetical protein
MITPVVDEVALLLGQASDVLTPIGQTTTGLIDETTTVGQALIDGTTSPLVELTEPVVPALQPLVEPVTETITPVVDEVALGLRRRRCARSQRHIQRPLARRNP